MKLLCIMGLSLLGSIAVLSVATHGGQATTGGAAKDQRGEAVVDASGNLRVPADYRTAYEFLGNWAIASDKGQGSKELHPVYASPGAIAAYRKAGRFPDGTVLVKEVFETATQKMTTGTVSRAQQLKGWFVMVKESKNTHPDSGLWGDGWAWAWFDPDNPVKTTSVNYKLECLACHEPARASDLVYVQGYPPLNRSH